MLTKKLLNRSVFLVDTSILGDSSLWQFIFIDSSKLRIFYVTCVSNIHQPSVSRLIWFKHLFASSKTSVEKSGECIFSLSSIREVLQVGPGNDILAITLSIAPVNAFLFWFAVQHLTLLVHSVIFRRFAFVTILYKNIAAGATTGISIAFVSLDNCICVEVFSFSIDLW